MTFAEFKSLVLENMGDDADRAPTQTLRDRAILNAMVDLQRYIRALRQANMDVMAAADLDVEGGAMVGTLPAGAKPKAFYIYLAGDEANCKRYRLERINWEDRQQMVCEKLPEGRYVFALSPLGRTFYIHPALTDDTRLLVMWEGYKKSWNANDVMMDGWDSIAAEAVAEFTKSRIIRDYDKTDPYAGIRRSDNHYKAYLTRRRDIYLDYHEGQFTGNEDVVAPASLTIVANAITALTSLDQLRGIATAGVLSINTTYSVVLDGALTQWMLAAGTDADDADLFVRPNDHNALTNARVWKRVTANILP